MLGALVLAERPVANPDGDAVRSVLAGALRRRGCEALPWDDAARSIRARIAFVGTLEPGGGWPAMDDDALMADLEVWLGSALDGITRLDALGRVELGAALRERLDHDQRRRLDLLAPTHVSVPTGNARPVDYGGPDGPVLAVRLQELFGARQGPSIGGGRVPLLLHLLSPAGRPVQVTRDLAGFWAGSYAEVRRDLRGRYPRHPWPEDPAAATPTARAKPRGT